MADPVTIATGVGWGISVAGWIVSPIISRLLNRGFSYLGFHSSSAKLTEVKMKVQVLQLTLEAIAVSPRSDKLELWMKEFRSAFYEADDILDAIDYQHLKNRVLSQADDESAGVNFRRFKQQVVRTMTDFKVSIPSRMKLKSSLDRIENLIDKGHKLLKILNLAASSDSINNTPNSTARSCAETTSAAPEVVFGRDNDLTMIRKMLRDTPADVEPSSSRTKCFSVIGIYGIPGSGKTTLAQYVCEKEKEDGFFNLIMWIHVSQNFSVGSVFTEMLEIASGGKRDQLSNLDMLQRELEEKLRGKKFFLVLDDVWYDKDVSDQQLDLLFSPLKVGEGGSSVLVTSRTADAAKAFGAQRLVPIADLDEEQYFSMFMHYAIDGATISDQALLGQYVSIGRKIAEKLGRSPLAARTVAGQLKRRPDVDFWRSSLNVDLSGTMGALWWSFRQLEEPVRQCFVYCSMFPRRYPLKRDILVRMWVAQGFVQTTNAIKDMEDIGNDYFHVLESSSFIQLKGKRTGGTDLFTIHDLLHDLARRVAGSDCFTVEKDMVVQIPQDTRHLFIDSREQLRVYIEKILELRNLRTLVYTCDYCHGLGTQDFIRLLQTLKKLRVVDVQVSGLEEIPACIGEFKHLRYLRIYGAVRTDLTLPSEFTKLYHLQVFSLPFYHSPRCSSNNKMANLVNLRHILFWGFCFPDVGRMTQLRTLPAFTVRRTRGYEIQQLEHLDNLRVSLSIAGLERINSKEEARQANLANKVHLSHLELVWSNHRMPENQDDRDLAERRTCAQNPDPQHEILEALCPPSQITSLSIWEYSGSTYPSWLTGEQSTLENLQYLDLRGCNGCDGPPRISSFVNLRVLFIHGCNWKSLPENMQSLTSLEVLTMHFCRSMLSLPILPQSLKKFSLRCSNRDLTVSCLEERHENWQKIKHVSEKYISEW